MKSRHQPPLPATLDASKRTGFFDLHIDTGDKKEERDRIRMDNVIAETQTAPSINSEELDRLVAEADKAKLKAYAPYSKFRVGAALLGSDGTIYPGANVENSSYGLTVCAERSAVFHAASCGARSFRAVVITTDISESTVYPCGACRQVMSEFGNFDVYCLRANGQISRTTLNDLIPYAFSPKDLSKGQGKAEEEEE